MEIVLLIALTVVAVAGASIGVVVAARSGVGDRSTRPADERERGLVRVDGEIHTGWEQTLVGLIRELQLPRSPAEIPYGALYLEPSTEHRIYVRTRSEIGRGFLGAIDITPRRGPTLVTYAILRLPGDEQLHARVLDFELRLISAMRRIDSNANVNLAADALREFDRSQQRTR